MPLHACSKLQGPCPCGRDSHGPAPVCWGPITTNITRLEETRDTLNATMRENCSATCKGSSPLCICQASANAKASSINLPPKPASVVSRSELLRAQGTGLLELWAHIPSCEPGERRPARATLSREFCTFQFFSAEKPASTCQAIFFNLPVVRTTFSAEPTTKLPKVHLPVVRTTFSAERKRQTHGEV